MKVKVNLCLIIIVMMLITSCSNNNKIAPTTYLEQKADSTTQELVSASPIQELVSASPEVNDASEPSIFDELANDMVYVESDAGSFFICKYEVTQKLWSEVMGENPSQMQGDNLPVEQVSWNDCQTFISKLNKLTKKHYRLPTEAEWEYACKGGKHSKGYKYSGSNDIDKVAWYDANSDGKTHPVGQKQPNELGLYDMSGNVWEWCQDMHEGTGMCRGGSWIHNARNCDPSLPNETPQSFYINSLGLRLANDGNRM
ncbi:MAG: formylglycine-generating enzyme family protein [Prevotella sp.]|nr:formylglycine-generating enzyme family protein [Prevotella sp.]